MRQIFRMWSTDQGRTFTPIEMLAVTLIIAIAAALALTMTPGIGRAQAAIAAANSPNILSEKEADSAHAIRMPIARLAQRL